MRRAPVFRCQLVRDRSLKYEPEANDAKSAAALFYDLAAGADRETFMVMALTAKNQVIGIHVAHVGTINASLVATRDVVKFAILCNACSIIVAHNHPSGVHDPSPEDYAVTRRLAEACKVFDVSLLDHIVIGNAPDDGFHSIQASGMLP